MQGKRLYVGNLDYTATSEDVKELFSAFGDVVDVFIDDLMGKNFRFKDILIVDPSEQISSVPIGNGFQFSDLPISDYPYILFAE